MKSMQAPNAGLGFDDEDDQNSAHISFIELNKKK